MIGTPRPFPQTFQSRSSSGAPSKTAERVAAHDEVDEDRGRLALQRGPLVYAAEAVDNGGRVLDLVLPEDGDLAATYREDLLGGVVAIAGTARRDGNDVPFLAVPYFSWANRGPGEMAVWIPSEPPAMSR